MSTATADESALDILRSGFDGGRDYLAACTGGLLPRAAVETLRAVLDQAPHRGLDMAEVDAAVAGMRADAARILGVHADDVAIGSQASVLVSLIAANLPDGAEVLGVEHDFSSLLLPFVHAGRGIRVRTVPLDRLAEEVRPGVDLVAFSLVQSATGEVADADAVVAAARAAGVRTLCDVTQAAGWMPVDAGRFDAAVCHAYKWLCAPRGVAFLAVSPGFAAGLRPVHANWYAGEDPWRSTYGTDAVLAASARRFDVSPAWEAVLGARDALAAFAPVPMAEVRAYTTGLAAAFRQGLGLAAPTFPSAIVTWPDPDGADLGRLTAAGITASGRAGRARVAFHVFNDTVDVARALAALLS
ncbi:aminotransferase class V-fold PLP-dependent enzyme [Microbacterium sp. GXF7504]